VSPKDIAVNPTRHRAGSLPAHALVDTPHAAAVAHGLEPAPSAIPTGKNFIIFGPTGYPVATKLENPFGKFPSAPVIQSSPTTAWRQLNLDRPTRYRGSSHPNGRIVASQSSCERIHHKPNLFICNDLTIVKKATGGVGSENFCRCSAGSPPPPILRRRFHNDGPSATSARASAAVFRGRAK